MPSDRVPDVLTKAVGKKRGQTEGQKDERRRELVGERLEMREGNEREMRGKKREKERGRHTDRETETE